MLDFAVMIRYFRLQMINKIVYIHNAINIAAKSIYNQTSMPLALKMFFLFLFFLAKMAQANIIGMFDHNPEFIRSDEKEFALPDCLTCATA